MRDARASECVRIRAHVSARLDGELSEFEQAELATHVGGCASCRSLAIELDAIARLLRVARYERPGIPIVVPRRRPGAVRCLRFAAAVAAMVAGAGLISQFTTRSDEHAPASAATSQHPTYLDSMDYERHLLAEARAVYRSARTGGVAHD